jgi:hypothetical protein
MLYATNNKQGKKHSKQNVKKNNGEGFYLCYNRVNKNNQVNAITLIIK